MFKNLPAAASVPAFRLSCAAGASMLLTHIHSNNSASMVSSALVILFLFAI